MESVSMRKFLTINGGVTLGEAQPSDGVYYQSYTITDHKTIIQYHYTDHTDVYSFFEPKDCTDMRIGLVNQCTESPWLDY